MKDYVKFFFVCFYQFFPVKAWYDTFPITASAKGLSTGGTGSTKFSDRVIQSVLHPSKSAPKAESCESKGVVAFEKERT